MPKKTNEKVSKSVKAWGVHHLGYYLICPTFGLAELEAKRFHKARVKQFLITEIN